jgi:hypothetical protein
MGKFPLAERGSGVVIVFIYVDILQDGNRVFGQHGCRAVE